MESLGVGIGGSEHSQFRACNLALSAEFRIFLQALEHWALATGCPVCHSSLPPASDGRQHRRKRLQVWEFQRNSEAIMRFGSQAVALITTCLIGCAKGICAKGFGGCTRFSLLRWEKGSETPSCGGKRVRDSLVPHDPFSHRKRENPVPPKIPLATIPLAQRTTCWMSLVAPRRLRVQSRSSTQFENRRI